MANPFFIQFIVEKLADTDHVHAHASNCSPRVIADRENDRLKDSYRRIVSLRARAFSEEAGTRYFRGWISVIFPLEECPENISIPWHASVAFKERRTAGLDISRR